MWIHFYKKSQSPWDWVRALIVAWVWWSRHRGGPWWPECQGHVAASEKPPRCGAHAWSPCPFSEGVSAGVENGSRREGRSVYCLFVVLLVAMVLVIPSMVAVVVIEVVIVVVITQWWRKNSSVFDPVFCSPGTISHALYALNYWIPQLSFEIGTGFTCILWQRKPWQHRMVGRILLKKLGTTLRTSSCNSRILFPRGIGNRITRNTRPLLQSRTYYLVQFWKLCLILFLSLEEGVGKNI